MNKKGLLWVGLGVVGGAIAIFFTGQAVASQMAAKKVDQLVADAAEFADVDYQKVQASLLGQGTKVKNVVISPVGSENKYKVDEIVLYQYDEQDTVPTHLKMAVNGMHLAVADMGANAAVFKELGYDKEIAMNFSTDYQYKAKDGLIQVKEFKLGADRVGDLAVNFQLANVDLSQESVAAMPMSLLSMTFQNALITYRDDSFLEKMFEQAAAAKKVSVAEFKKEAIASLKQDPNMIKALSEEQRQEIEKFINSPEKFAISMSPDQPVPFTSLMGLANNPSAVTELLSLKFQAN